MNIIGKEMVKEPNIKAGHFNRCEHVFLELEAGKNQTVSVKLPDGRFVTFAFISGSAPNSFECCDIHSTVGKMWDDDKTLGVHCWEQHLVGFSKGRDTFDTRKIVKDKGVSTALATLLLAKDHHPEAG